MAVAWRAIDRDTGVHQPLAGFIDILDPVRQMPEIATLAVAALVPIMRKFDLGTLIAGGSEEDQGEPACLIIKTA